MPTQMYRRRQDLNNPSVHGPSRQRNQHVIPRFANQRSSAVAQQRLQQQADASDQARQLGALQTMANTSQMKKMAVVQRVIDLNHQGPGRSGAALSLMQAAGGRLLMREQIGFGAGDNVGHLEAFARRIIGQFVPPGGVIDITNNAGVSLANGVALIQDENYTATPMALWGGWGALAPAPGGHPGDDGGAGGGPPPAHLLPAGLLDE